MEKEQLDNVDTKEANQSSDLLSSVDFDEPLSRDTFKARTARRSDAHLPSLDIAHGGEEESEGKKRDDNFKETIQRDPDKADSGEPAAVASGESRLPGFSESMPPRPESSGRNSDGVPPGVDKPGAQAPGPSSDTGIDKPAAQTPGPSSDQGDLPSL